MKVDKRKLMGKTATNKPHMEDRVEEKEGKEIYNEKTPQHNRKKGDVGGFEDAHVVVDKEAHGIKMSREKQKMSGVKKQDYSMGVGAPGNTSAHLPHHNDHNPAVYRAESTVPGSDSGKHGEDHESSDAEY